MCTHTAAFQSEGTKQRNEKGEKLEGKYAWSAPVYVGSVYTSLAVNMKKKKKAPAPFWEADPGAGKQAFGKVH